MLIVTRLKLENICQYDSIDVPLATGLMAVCGRNGSGKSTLLRGLMYGLTGLVDGSWGTQANLQKDGCAVPGYVVVTLHDDRTNNEYIIKRYSAAGAKFADSVTLYKDGEYKEVATRRKTVDAYLSELYGIPVQLLFQLVWGRQGQLDLLLTAPAAYVSTFLSSVFDMRFLENIRDKIKAATDRIAAYDDATTAMVNTGKEQLDLKQRLEGMQKLASALEARIQQATEIKANLEQQLAALNTEGIQKAASLHAAYETAQRRCDLLLRSMSVQAKQLVISDSDLDERIEWLNESLIQCHDTIGDLEDSIEEARETARKGELEARDSQAKLVAVTEALDTVTKEKQKLAEGVFHDGAEKCILCGHNVGDKSYYVSQMLWLMGYEGIEACDDWAQPFDQRIEELIQQQTDARRDCENLRFIITEAGKTLDTLHERFNTVSQSQQQWNDELAMLQQIKLYRQAKADMDAAEKAAAQTDSNSAAFTEATNQLKGINETINNDQATLDNIRTDIVRYQERIASCDQRLEWLDRQQEQHDINESARGMLLQLRDVFSQQRAQARYLAYKADELNDKLKAFMEMTSMPFSLYLDKDARVFKYTTEGGYEHPTAHLSGAQKNISAVALQMALVEVISPNINLFLFDEPSEALDTENKIVMAELFKRMNRLLPSIGGTMLIVSRDEPLIEACENTININQKETSDDHARSS